MRPMHAPGKAVALCGSVDLVFLRVVKVFQRQARLAFAQRRVGQRSRLGIGFKWAKVMLQASDQRDMAHALFGRQGVEQVTHQRRIDADILRFGVLAHPGGNEHVGRRHIGQRGAQRLRVQQVGRDMVHIRQILRRAARQTDHLPAVDQQFARDMVAANPGNTHNQRCSFHVIPCVSMRTILTVDRERRSRRRDHVSPAARVGMRALPFSDLPSARLCIQIFAANSSLKLLRAGYTVAYENINLTRADPGPRRLLQV